MRALQVGLIGDFDESVTAHRAIPVALRLAGEALQRTVEFDWLATDAMPSAAALTRFDALWCVPASPYRSMDGALNAIRFARELRVPFLGTCGGFQHALIEVARNLLGLTDAEHAETAPGAASCVVSELACSLVEVSDVVSLRPGSRLALAYAGDTAIESYHCRYGLNPAFASRVLNGPLRASAHDAQGETRAVELDDHPFFVGTLFQPERAALSGTVPPLARALLTAALAR
jgi:CTP synthase (UTP-ammonia lyase)